MADAEIETRGLQEAIARLRKVGANVDDLVEEQLGEMSVGFFEDLTGFEATRRGNNVRRQLRFPGNGIWPVGARIPPIRSDRYAPHDGESGIPTGAVESGRSLGAWRMDLTGMTLRLINDARDNKRSFYARYVHKVGDPTGQALKDALGSFRSRAADVTKAMQKVLAREMRGG